MNPFRVKPSTVVATRMKMTLKSTWLEPLANRDDTISLIGQRIRCILPKNFVFQSENIKSASWTRLFEGEVVGFVEPWHQESMFLHIKMLIPRENAKQLPFPLDEYKDNENVSAKERSRREYESIIKGSNNVIIHVKIPRVARMSKNCIRWTICKNIHNRSLIGYIGDWNDSIEQQGDNHLWCVKHEQYHKRCDGSGGEDGVRVGEVIKIVPFLRDQQDGKPKSLAHVSIRPLMFLEDTIRGRMEHDYNNELLEYTMVDATSDNLIELPIEDLIVIGNKLVRDIENYEESAIAHGAYDFIVRSRCDREKIPILPHLGRQVHGASTDPQNASQTKICKVCSKSVFGISMFTCASCSGVMHRDCFVWDVKLRKLNPREEPRNVNECYECEKRSQVPSDDENQRIEYSPTGHIANVINRLGPKDFDFPNEILESLPISKARPIESDAKKKLTKFVKEKSSPANNTISDRSKTSKKQRKYVSRMPIKIHEPIKILISKTDFSIIGSSLDADMKGSENSKNNEIENETLEGMCSRIMPYDPSKKIMRSSNNSAAHAKIALASSRSGGRKGNDRVEQNVNQTHGRASRINQRRMLKDSAFFGIIKDKLTGCENALRFGKSLIHGWGVFTDEHISKGDLIVEYRGVLIGHAVANKREKEYEDAKIGSDYMFRISNSVICDATHEGNVTRFINACCSPNCYPKILVVNGVKRIAIYAKKDILPGEELSYDYKFQPEFDETKRIPCNCGSPDCRKFMNWDHRYVAVPPRQSDTAPPNKLRTKNI